MHVNITIFTKITMIMALVCAMQADQTETVYVCSVQTECKTCTTVENDFVGRVDMEVLRITNGANMNCWWSTERQACVLLTSAHQNATTEAPAAATTSLVRDPADCPRLQMVRGGDRAVSDEPYAYRVNVTNDAAVGLVSYLGHVGFACLTDGGVRREGRVIRDGRKDGGVIECEAVARNRGVGHFRVQFGPHNATLRLDREEDYYVAFYDPGCDGRDFGSAHDEGCVDCEWAAEGYKYYIKRCLTRNCLKPFEYYDRRYVEGAYVNATPWVNGVSTMCERSIKIESFKPTAALWSGAEVNVTVRVKNHRILSNGTTVYVTIAGRECSDPQTSSRKEDSLTCTVPTGAPTPDADLEGPVRVVYAGDRELTVESAKTFRFVVPRVTGPFCGPLSGGTWLTVSGIGLADAPSLNVSVQWADGSKTPCHVVRKTSDEVECSTAPVPSPKGRGHVRVDADGRWSLLMKDHGFEYVNTSRPVDGGRRLSGIASGGTSVTVHQDWPGCAQHVWFRVFSVSSWIKCRARHGAFECRSPKYADDGAGGEARGGTNGRGPGNESAPVALLKCDFGVAFFGVREYREFVKRPCPEEGYAVYADPAFEDFVAGDDGQVTVYGRGRLGLGFGASDVSVRFGDRNAGPCIVLDVRPDRIVCAADVRTAERLVAGDLHEVLVKVGDAAKVTVPRRRRASSVPDESDRLTKAWLLLPLLLGFVVLSWWWLKKRKAVTRYRSAVRLSDLSTEH